jgi:hypothetical protein
MLRLYAVNGKNNEVSWKYNSQRDNLTCNEGRLKCIGRVSIVSEDFSSPDSSRRGSPPYQK